MYLPSFRFLATALIATACPVVGYSQNVLFIGNSFTMGLGGTATLATPSGVGSIFEALATDASHSANVQMVAFPGYDLQTHATSGSPAINAIINGYGGQDWDAVVLQEYSTYATDASSGGNVASFQNALSTLANTISFNNPSADVVLYETWARDAGHPIYNSGQFTGPADMQQQVNFHYGAAEAYLESSIPGLGADDVHVANAGSTWGQFQHSDCSDDIDLYDSDSYHGSDHGYYLSALEIFRTIYDEPTTGLTNVFDTISTTEAHCLQKVVEANYEAVPEPSSAVLAILAGAVFATRRKRA